MSTVHFFDVVIEVLAPWKPNLVGPLIKDPEATVFDTFVYAIGFTIVLLSILVPFISAELGLF